MQTISIQLPLIIAKPIELDRILLLKIALTAGVALFLLSTAFYIFQMGDLIKLTYQISASEAGIAEINQSNLLLKAESINELSLASIEQKIQKLDFVEQGNVKYIPIPQNYLVKNSQ